MKRVIEELIENRKQNQSNLQQAFKELGELVENSTLFSRKKGKITKKCEEISHALGEWVTSQDKEWDAYSNNHSTLVQQSLHLKIDKLEAEYGKVKSILTNFLTLEKKLHHLINSIGEKTDPSVITELKGIKEQLSVFQYADFEQRFRGDSEKIREDLKRYLPYFAQSDKILDIGCGRGEFLKLMIDQGKEIKGIDISHSMLEKAREEGIDSILNVDALQFLRDSGEGSFGGIFSSQVIEHFDPGYLREIVTESFRVLQPGSPILLETINPLSLFALSNIFYMDVTHQKPLHPEYMRYLLGSTGFSDISVIYSDDPIPEQLEEISTDNSLARTFNSNVDKLNKILFNSPIYAITGIKK